MKLIVVTGSTTLDNEHEMLERMVRHGLKYLHVRKPKYTREKMVKYLQKFSDKALERIIIHSHHSLALSMNLKGIHLTEKHRDKAFGVWKKFNLYRLMRKKMHISTSYHKLQDINHSSKSYDYVFFSPVFESISKEDHEPSYSLGSMYDTLHHAEVEVIALGGVDAAKIATCYETRFSGVALSGALWTSDNPVDEFDKAKDICSEFR